MRHAIHRMKHRVMRGLVLMAAAGLVAACSSGPVPKDRFYRLDIAPGTMAAAPLPGVLEVQAARVQGLLSGRALAYEDSDGVLKQRDYHYWTEPPAKLLQSAMIDALRARGLSNTVISPEFRAARDFEIIPRLRRFEEIRGSDTAVVEIELALRRVASASRLLLIKTYSAKAQAANHSEAAFAVAMGQAVSAVIDRFVADVAALNIGRERAASPSSDAPSDPPSDPLAPPADPAP